MLMFGISRFSESDGRANPRIRREIVVRIAVVVDIAPVGRVTRIRGREPPVVAAFRA